MPRSKRDVPSLEKEVRELKREVSRLQKLLEQDFPVKEEYMLAEVDRLAALPKDLEKRKLCSLCGGYGELKAQTVYSGYGSSRYKRKCPECKNKENPRES